MSASNFNWPSKAEFPRIEPSGGSNPSATLNSGPFSPMTTTTASSTRAPAQKKSIDLNSQTDFNYETSLTFSCAGGFEDLVRLLLARGANIEHRTKLDLTPLMIATISGHVQIVDRLLAHGADLEAEMHQTKDTALSLACSIGDYAMVKCLLSGGANKEHRIASGLTPLGIAVSTGHFGIINLLLRYGAEITNRTDMSPLMLAVLKGDVEITRLLLDRANAINVSPKSTQIMELTFACHRVHLKMAQQAATIQRDKEFGEIYENIANVVLAELKKKFSRAVTAVGHRTSHSVLHPQSDQQDRVDRFRFKFMFHTF